MKLYVTSPLLVHHMGKSINTIFPWHNESKGHLAASKEQFIAICGETYFNQILISEDPAFS